MKYYTCDFETNNDENDCRVWLWGKYDVENDKFLWGTDLNELFYSFKESCTIYFHNLKFDGEFLLYYLFRNGYKYGDTKKVGNFSATISDKGVFYSMCVNMGGKRINIIDSLKIIPFSVAEMAKAFGLPMSKGDIDYDMFRPLGYKPTDDEISYIYRDCKIAGLCLKILRDQGLNKNTQASNAFLDYNKMIGKENFRKLYPVVPLEIDKLIRKAYRGGYTYLNPKYANKVINKGLVFDVNSLYPYVMHDKTLPYGEPMRFEGKYQENKEYPLYIQCIKCQFKLKEGYTPTLQIKHGMIFKETEYLTESGNEYPILWLTNIDLDIFMKHYDVYNIEYYGGFCFKEGNFMKDYVEKWYKIKRESKKNGNKGMYTLSKLMQNALYGRFALNPEVINMVPEYIEENDVILYKASEKSEREPIYTALAVFVTAYARQHTINAIEKNYDKFVYCDTDSIHLHCKRYFKPDINIDDYKLGDWKNELIIEKAKYIRSKTYLEIGHEPGKKEKKKVIACAGLPKDSREKCTIRNFKIGAVYEGGKKSRRVSGGVMIKPVDFKIRD